MRNAWMRTVPIFVLVAFFLASAVRLVVSRPAGRAPKRQDTPCLLESASTRAVAPRAHTTPAADKPPSLLGRHGEEEALASTRAIADALDAGDLTATAEILSRSTSHAAVRILIEHMQGLTDGRQKEALAHVIERHCPRATLSILEQTLLETRDRALARACQAALARMADEALVERLAAAYGNAPHDEQRRRILGVFDGVVADEATSALIGIARATNGITPLPLVQVAIRALGRIGSERSARFLLECMDVAPSFRQDELMCAIVSIRGTTARPLLEGVARGEHPTRRPETRAAATMALANYPLPETQLLLEALAQDERSEVAPYARDVLSGMRGAAAEGARKTD